MKRLIALIFVLFISHISVFGVTHAQEAQCPVIVRQALDLTTETCIGTGTNQICYGNTAVIAQPQPGFETLQFSQPGDITDIESVQSLTMSALNETTGEWGITLMRLQATLAGTLPGENVTFLVFGDVAVENISSQAFYFRSGVNDAACIGAPQSGILIQTPQNAGLVNISVNDVNISLGSTAFLQAQPANEMRVNLIEGLALIAANGSTRSITGGQRVRIPIDTNMMAAGTPSPPEPIDVQTLQSIPIADIQTLAQPMSNQPPPISTVPPPPCNVQAVGTQTTALHVGPGTNRSSVGFLDATLTVPVTGRALANDNTLWWQLDKSVAAPTSAANQLWVADTRVTTTGDCTQVVDVAAPPIIPVLPTAQPPAPTIPGATPGSQPTDSGLPIAGDNEARGLTVGPGQPVSVSGAISAPQGDRQDTIAYRWVNFNPVQAPSGTQFRISVTCTGMGVENALIEFDDGSIRDCSPTPYNFVQLMYTGVPTAGSFVIRLTTDDPAFVNWNVSLSFFVPSS